MTTIELLKSCRAAILELQEINKQMSRVLPTGQPSGVMAQQYKTTLPGTNEPVAAAIQLHDGLHARAEKARDEWQRLSALARPVIMNAASARDMVILDHYYVMGMTDQEIARQQKLVREQVCRIRHDALAALCN